MGNVQRWRFYTGQDERSYMVHSEFGEWVEHGDYADLERQLAESKAREEEATRHGANVTAKLVDVTAERDELGEKYCHAVADCHKFQARAERAESQRGALLAVVARAKEAAKALRNILAPHDDDVWTLDELDAILQSTPKVLAVGDGWTIKSGLPASFSIHKQLDHYVPVTAIIIEREGE